MRIMVETVTGEIQEARASPFQTGARWAQRAPGTLIGSLEWEPRGAPRVVCRSGYIPMEEEPERADPRTWAARGWEALGEAVRRTTEGEGATVLIRPSWMDVVSDAPSCLRLLERRAEWGAAGRLGILLDPAAMLAPSMAAAGEDHIRRVLELVAAQEGVAGVVASNFASERSEIARRELHQGEIDATRLAHLYRSLVPGAVPLIVSGTEPERQASLLAEA